MKRSYVFAVVVCLMFMTAFLPERALAQQHFRLRIGSDSAYAGQTVTIPVILSNPAAAKAAGVTDITLVFHFDATTLAPSNTSQQGKVGSGIRRIFMALLVTSNTDSVITAIPMQVALGETPLTVFVIDSAYTNTPSAVLDKQNGIFTLRGVCHAGGERLLNPNGIASVNLAQNFSNGEALSATVNTCEDGTTRLYLVDMIGRRAKTFLDDAIPTGEHKMQLDISDVAGGKYLLVFETPTRKETQAVEVVR